MSWSVEVINANDKFGMKRLMRNAWQIKTTFIIIKSISFEEVLQPDIIRSYATQTTGKNT